MPELTIQDDQQRWRAQAELIQAGLHPTRQAGLVRLLRRLVWPFIRPFHFHTLDRLAAADAAIGHLQAEVGRLATLTMDTAKLHALEARMDRSEARMDVAAGDIEGLLATRSAPAPEAARLEALEAGIHALRDARRPTREQEVARFDRIEIRLDVLEIWADGQRRRLEHIESAAAGQDDVARMVTLNTRLRSDLLAIGNRHVWVEQQAAAALQTAEQVRDAVAGETQAVHQRLSALDGLQAARTMAQAQLDRLEADTMARAASLTELQGQVHILQEGLFLTTAQEGLFLLKTGELISESVRRDGAWDPHILHVAARAAEVVHGRPAPPSTLLGIDVGAHFGLISVALAKLFDRVISFEPNIFNAMLLRANVLLNGLDGRMDIRREALAAREGTLSLAPSERQEIPLPVDEQGRFAPGHATNLGAYSFVRDGTGLSEAHAIPLDQLALDGVGFIKIDAQGGDGTVLLGAMQTIARCRPWVIFEWETVLAEAFAVPFEEIEARLAEIGYQVTVLHRHNEKQIDYLAIPQEEAGAREPSKAD